MKQTITEIIVVNEETIMINRIRYLGFRTYYPTNASLIRIKNIITQCKKMFNGSYYYQKEKEV